MEKKKNERQFVAKCEEIFSGFRCSRDYSAVYSFNSQVLPLLKDLDAFEPSNTIPDFYGLSMDHLYAAFVSKELKKCKTEMEREMKRTKIKEAFEEWKDAHTWNCPQVEVVSEKGLSYTKYDKRLGVFVIDDAQYAEDTLNVYASTPEELKALQKLKEAVAALNALHFDKLMYSVSGRPEISLCDFITIEDGKAKINEYILPASFRMLAERVK